MTTSTPSSSSSSNKTSARSFMARTGFLVSVVCAAAAFGGGLATLVQVKNNTSNSRPYDRGDHPRTEEAAALQHRLAVVETQLAEVTATVVLLTTTIGTDTDTVRSSNRRRVQRENVPGSGDLPIVDLLVGSVARDRKDRLFQKRVQAFLNRDNRPLKLMVGDEMEATLPPDNDLVCTPFRGWILSIIFRCPADEERCYPVDSNRTIYVDNAVGETEKKTMYKPTAQNIGLCDGDQIACPTPTEELGIFAGNFVEYAAGPTIGDDYSSWRNYMVLLDPVVIKGGNGPLTQYRSSFAYTEYDYVGADDSSPDGTSAEGRVPEFPITGGTGRFGSASGSVKNTGYTFITNEATGYDEEFIEVQFNVCVPPPKTTNPVQPGPPKKSGKAPKASF